MANVDHVLNRPPDHALGARVGAAADGHYARNGLDIRLDATIRLPRLVNTQMLGSPFGGLLWVDLQHLID